MEIIFQEIWALGKIIYFIYKIILFFLNLTEIKKFKFCFLKIIFQNSDEKKCFKLVETKKLYVCLIHIPHMTYTFNIYYIVLHYKEIFFKHIPDTAYMMSLFSTKKSLFETYIPDITFTLNIYVMFTMYIR